MEKSDITIDELMQEWEAENPPAGDQGYTQEELRQIWKTSVRETTRRIRQFLDEGKLRRGRRPTEDLVGRKINQIVFVVVK